MEKHNPKPVHARRLGVTLHSRGSESAHLEKSPHFMPKNQQTGIVLIPSERTDSRLREFLADEYHRRKRHDAAMKLVWAEFTEAPHLDRYRTLKKHADRCQQWPAWREQALAFLRSEIANRRGEASKRGAPWWSARIDNSDLVSIFLSRGDLQIAMAVRSTAEQRVCGAALPRHGDPKIAATRPRPSCNGAK